MEFLPFEYFLLSKTIVSRLGCMVGSLYGSPLIGFVSACIQCLRAGDYKSKASNNCKNYTRKITKFTKILRMRLHWVALWVIVCSRSVFDNSVSLGGLLWWNVAPILLYFRDRDTCPIKHDIFFLLFYLRCTHRAILGSFGNTNACSPLCFCHVLALYVFMLW